MNSRERDESTRTLVCDTDDLPEDNLPEPIALTPEQLAVQAEAEERNRQLKRDWAAINKALRDNSMAVMRAMHPWYPRDQDRERQIERVMTSYEDGSFLLNRIGAECVLDQDLAVLLLDLRRRLIDEYGDTPAATMLIDRAVVAYQDFIRAEGWAGNLAIHIEHEFFGLDGPSAHFRDRYRPRGERCSRPLGRRAPCTPARRCDPARRALRPGDARGARGAGSSTCRPKPGGRTIEANQGLGHVWTVRAVTVTGRKSRSRNRRVHGLRGTTAPGSLSGHSLCPR